MPAGANPGRRRDVGGPHELGQNFLVDPRVVDRLTGYVPRDPLPVVELGPGDYLAYPGDEPHVFTALEDGTFAVLVSEHV